MKWALRGACPFAEHARTWSNVVISVTDGTTKVSLPAFSLIIQPNPNKSPTITGTPPTTATVGKFCSFTPTGKHPEGKPVTFSLMSKPTWATFNKTTGQLSGTPTAAGVFKHIMIVVSDGVSAAALPASTTSTLSVSDGKVTTTKAFSIKVNASSGGGTVGSVTLNWTPPTKNTDGSTLTNLAGYRIVYGKSAGALTSTVQIANPGIASYVVDNLASGTWYFALQVYTSSGTESALTSVVSKTIP